MNIGTTLLLAIGVSLFMTPNASCALNCAKQQPKDYQAGTKDGTMDARESYDKNPNQHGYPAATSDGPDGQCYRSAYDAAYDKAKGTTAKAPARKQFGKHVFSPASGVICDTYGTAYCADGTGVSASFTEQYLGPEAAHKLSEMVGDGNFDGSTFVLSNGVQCRVNENACFKGKGGTVKDPAITKVLFP